MTTTLKATRVVLVDDHPAMRAGVRSVIERTTDLCVVGEAGSGEQALKVLRKTGANVVLLDIGLPDIDGIELLAGIHDACAGAKVIMLSCQTDEASVRMAIDGGASGYLTKITSPHDIVDAVRSVQAGQVAISPDVASALISAIRAQRRPGEPTLTAREREVWRAMAGGLSNAQIAKSLFLSEHTVKFHVHNLLGKLGLKSRSEAICAAHRRGMATA